MTSRSAWLWATMLAVALIAACGSASQAQEFPEIDRAALSDTQLRIVDVLRDQFDTQPPGTFYSEGVDEPWCADFVSWVMNETGRPFVNPNSGHWRIPGVYTLQEYFQATGTYEEPGYQPAVGDVVLYDERSALGLHANVVVAADADAVVTVGGNEPGGGITVRTLDLGEAAVLGYGRLA